jgi:hypothetical protein
MRNLFWRHWTTSNLKAYLKDVKWSLATPKVNSFNTIATLIFHINYYVNIVTKVLKAEALACHDRYNFDHPPK